MLIAGGPLYHMQCAAWVHTNTFCQPCHTLACLCFCDCCVHKRRPLASASLYYRYSASLQDKVVMPRMQWIHQKREQMADALGLPDVDVAALEATGRSHVPSM